MKKAFLIFAILFALTANARATTTTISAYQLQNLPFNPTNIGSARTFTVTPTPGVMTVTSSAAFPSNIVGIGGFQILIGSTQYIVASVQSTSLLTLTANYSGGSGSATMTLYPYVLLRAYATAGFQDNVTGQNVQAGTPGSGNFYKQVAVSIINSGSGNVAYMPEFTLPSTTDALINNQARYVFGFYRTDNSFLSFYLCGSVQQLAIQPNTPTTWTAICNFNSPGGVVPPNNEVYTKSQIDQRLASCTAGQLYYFAANGNILSCLTLGTNLSITSGTLNAAGGGGGGSIGAGVAGNLAGYSAPGTNLVPFTVGAQLTVSGTTLKTSGVRPAINAVVDYGVVCDGATNTIVSLQNAVTAAAAVGGMTVVLPSGNCRIAGTLTVPGGVVLEGQGMRKTIISSVANAIIVNAVEGSGDYAFLGPTIRDLMIQGSASGSSQIGLKADDVVGPDLYFAQGVFENIQIYNAGSHGLYVGNAFSSRFINIYSDDNNGYPFYINSANMPSNHYESLYAQKTNAGANAGFRILAGNFICISCNGINVSAAGSWNAILGQSIAQGDAANVSAFAQWQNTNFESAKAGGIDHRYNSTSTFSGHNQFAGDGASSGAYIAMRYEIDTAIFPPYFAKGTIDGSVVFANYPESFYTNSSPIHANDLPPLTVNGQGPKIAGGAAQTAYQNTTSGTTQQLYRSDAYYPTVAVTTTTSFSNPGPRYFEVTCGSDCQLTLPWPGWYQPGGESIIVKNLSTSGIVVTIGANNGGSVNTPIGYTMTEQYQSVTLIPDSTELDYRVISKVYPGVATRIPVYSDTANQTTVSGLAWDAGSSVLTSPGRFWGANTSAGAPTFAFTSDFSTGFYLSSAGNVGFASVGGARMLMGNTLSLLNYGASTGQTGTLSLFDLDNSASVSLRSPDVIASPFTLTLPSALPGSTQCLQLSATGVISATGSACASGGTLAVANGGTGATTFTTNGVLYGNGTSPIQVTAAGGAGTLCLVSTNGAAPVFGSCAGSAATALSSISAASTTNTISSGDNGSQIWQWSLTTNSTTAFSFTESAASAATSSYILNVNTLATSTAKPFKVTAGGTTAGVEMSTAGSLGAIGTGGIVATTGDSATAFFASGQIEAARGGTGADASGSTGIPLVTAGTWTFTAGIANLASSTSADLRGVLSDETGTGVAVFATTPTLVTPVLGVATATSINKVAITAPATSATLTIADGKTLTASNSLTLAGTDATTITFQGTGTYISRTSTDTLTGKTYDTAGSGNAFSINGQSVTTVSGNTSKVGTTGTPSSGKCLEWDANGNIVTSVSNVACGSGGTTINATDTRFPYRLNSTTFSDSPLARISANEVEQSNSTNAQVFGVTGTKTDSSNYLRFTIAVDSTVINLSADTLGTGADNVDINLIPAGTGIVTAGSGGSQVTTRSDNLSVFSATTSAQLAGVISNETGTGVAVFATTPTLVTPVLGVASATSIATSAATPLLLTNGQLVNIALTSQTVGATTLTIPNFASVSDQFTFNTLAQTLANKTLTTPTIASFTNATHNHTNAAGGGQLTDAALSAAVGVAKGGTGVTTIAARSIWLANATDTITSVTPAAGQSIRINAGNTAWEAYAPGACATCVTSAAALTANSIVLGDGLQASKTAAGFTTDGVSVLTLGVASTSLGQIVLQNAANANTITLASAVTTTSYTLALPAAAPGSTQCMRMGVSGAVSFSGADCLTAAYNLILEEGSALTQRATFNFVGSALTAADDAGNSRTNVTVDDDVNALASNSTDGLWAHTAAGTGAARTLTGTTNVITITDGNGVAGNPTFTVGSLVVRTDQANTYSTGAQSFSAATSLTLPVSAGAAPTANGIVAYDSTANDLEYGDNGTNRKVANLDEAQTFDNKTLTTPSFTTGFTIGGVAATGTIPRGNGTNFIASAYTMAAPGTTGNVLTSDGTNWLSSTPAGGGANTALSNLAAVSINTSLIPQTGVNLGAAATAFKDLFLYGSGTFATTSLKLTGTPTGNRTVTFPDATDTVALLAETQTLTNKTIDGATNTIIFPWSDLDSSGSNVTFSNTSFNSTFTQTTGLWAFSGNGNITTSNFFALSHSNTSATGDLLDLSTAVSVSIRPLRVTPRGTDAFLVDHLGNAVMASAALSTSATDGFLYITSTAGTPIGTPTAYTGRTPINWDSTNNILYVNEAGTWISTAGAAGSPGGSTTQVQYNNAGAFGGISGITSNGTNLTAGATNLRATSPFFTTDISDSNGNEVLKITATGSAVNEFTVINAATGANPNITASGGDTNIGIDLQVKGTGVFNHLATASGPADVRLFEDTDNGTNYASLIATNSMASNRVLTLPDVTGTLTALGNTTTGSGSSIALSTSPDITTSITTPSTTFALVNTTATTVNFAGAATTLNVGASATLVMNLGGAASAAELRFLEPSGGGTSYTGFKSPALADPVMYTLPIADGTSGQVLSTNASGTLSWATAGGSTINASGSFWNLSDVYGSDSTDGTATTVYIHRKMNWTPIVLDRSVVRGVVNAAAGSFVYSVRSHDCSTTTYFSATVSTTAWAGTAMVNTLTSETLPAGSICIMWAHDNTTSTIRAFTPQANLQIVKNAGKVQLASCANTLSGTTLPSSCGTETTSTSKAIPEMSFYKN